MPQPISGIVGEKTGGRDGTVNAQVRQHWSGELSVSEYRSRYFEMTRLGQVFTASIAFGGVTAATVAGTPMLSLYNPSTPAAPQYHLEVLTAEFWSVSGTPGVGGIEVQGGAWPSNVALPTWNVTPYSALIGSGLTSVAKAGSALALGWTPGHIGVIASIITAVGVMEPAVIEVAGRWVVPPGGLLAMNPQTAGTTWLVGGAFTFAQVLIP
jgi:hypothetical protein